MEVLNKSCFSLQMGNCPIPVAEDPGLCCFVFELSLLRNMIKWSWCRSKNAKVLKKKYLSLTYFRESFGTTFLENIGCCWQVHLNLTHHKNKFLNKCFKSYGSMMSYHPGAPQMIETFNLNLYDIYVTLLSLLSVLFY